MIMTKIKSVLSGVRVAVAVAVAGSALGGMGVGLGLFFMGPVAVAQAEAPQPQAPPAAEETEMPPHFVEKPDMKPQVDNRLPYEVVGEPTEEQILVASKTFISDSRNPGKVRFRELIDPRYLKKHGLTDRDLVYEVGEHVGLHNYQVADDLRTVLFIVDTKGGQRELIIARWVVHEGHLYLSPEKGPDPKTGIFRPWILQMKAKGWEP
jgi:hypothetical protein